MSKFRPYTDGEWIDLARTFKNACCDCHLVHAFEFRVKNGVIQWRAFRDNRATANLRRSRKRAA